MAGTQFDKKIKMLRSDSGGEYVSHKFRNFLADQGTIPQLSRLATQQENSVGERKHSHIIETTRSVIYSSHVPPCFWGKSVLTAVYVTNRTPSSVLSGMSPYEKLFQIKPDLSHLKVFGCTCFVLLPEHERTKLAPRSSICVFLGYGIEQKGFRCYDPKANRLRISCNASFLEHVPYYTLLLQPLLQDNPPSSLLILFQIYFHLTFLPLLLLHHHLHFHHHLSSMFITDIPKDQLLPGSK
eukprot:TRINITY_DN6387_c0_g1_i1.p1 TRINITY_DN6387_c0_g1~~TRINITY_DN6387_c0_g1_i1.p1  ORF type:complete len:240 (-),score=23.48 TRINITY_DN6387_c0_g1_i1:1835-2554(-)